MRSGRFAAAVFLATVFVGGEVFAQAAAESVLTHSLSSGAASSLGKTLGKTMGNATGQMAGRLGQRTSGTASRPRVAAGKPKDLAQPTLTAAPDTAASSSAGPLIVSIQGAASSSTCVAAPKPAAADSSTSDAPVSSAGAPASDCLVAPSQDAETHPAVVDLPPAR